MAKLVLAMFMSLDGYVARRDGGLAPPPWSDDAATQWAAENLSRASHLLYGRVNFEFNKAHWTSPAAAHQAETPRMDALPKTVASRTLFGDLGWRGLATQDLGSVVARLKAEVSEGDIYSFGGAKLARSLMDDDLVDEFRLMITPTILGDGQRLFEPGVPPVGLTLIDVRTLDVGSVILHYRRHAG